MIAAIFSSKIFLGVLVGEFLLGAACALWEKNWGMFLYFLGAAVLNWGLIVTKG